METKETTLEETTLEKRLEEYKKVLEEIDSISTYLDPNTIPIAICGYLRRRTTANRWEMLPLSVEYDKIERIVIYHNESVPECFVYVQTEESNKMLTIDYLFLLESKREIDSLLEFLDSIYEKNTLLLIYRLEHNSLLSTEIHKEKWKYASFKHLLDTAKNKEQQKQKESQH